MLFRHWVPALLLVALGVAGCASAPSIKPATKPAPTIERPVVFRGARVFDGISVIDSADVLVERGKISNVGNGIAAPANAEVIDAHDMTLLPGLIDAHTHTGKPEELRQAAIFGVTTELDMMGDPRIIGDLKRQLATGALSDAADLLSAGNPFTVPGGHGTEDTFEVDTITDPAQALAFVRRRVAEGSNYVKFMLDDRTAWGDFGPSLSRQLLEAGIAAAHAEKRLALVHIGTSDEALTAVQSGADGLMHLWVGEFSPDLIAEVAQHHAFVVPTLSLLQAIGEQFPGEELARDPHLLPYLSDDAEGLLHAGWGFAKTIDCHPFYPAIAALHQHQVPLLVGTDSGDPGVDHGVSMHGELRLLTEAGVPPLDALKGATSLTATIFGLNDRGRIEAGRLADLLLVRGDPTQNILATRDIVGVWKAGKRIDRETFRAKIAQQRAHPRASAPPRIIGDFEYDDSRKVPGVSWMASSDMYIGGRSTATLEIVAGGALGTAHALRVAGLTERSAARRIWSGVLYFPSKIPMQKTDLSSWHELVFWAKGDGAKYHVMFFLSSTTIPQSQSFVATPDWTEYHFDFRRFRGTSGKDVKGILFGITVPGTHSFTIDQVQLR
jgi:imidazolonepropionase-like amidohydrolase